MADPFRSHSDTVDDPSRAPFAVVPHDSDELTLTPKALYIGTGGDLTLRGIDGTGDVVFKNLPSGSILAVRPKYVRATGTSATDIVGLA